MTAKERMSEFRPLDSAIEHFFKLFKIDKQIVGHRPSMMRMDVFLCDSNLFFRLNYYWLTYL